MKRVAYAFAAVGILSAAFILVPRFSGGRVIYSFRFFPNKSPDYYRAAEAALEGWLVEKGFARVSADRFEAPATPPFTVVLAKAPGDLNCTFDWSYGDWSWFESEDHKRARAFSSMLKAWRDAYMLQNP